MNQHLRYGRQGMANLAVRTGVFAALTALACAKCPGAAALRLVKEGASDYGIVVPDAPTVQERFAAAELQKYLALISGAKIELQAAGEEAGRKIVIAVAGRAKRAANVEFTRGDADLDAFAIETDGDSLLLIGGNKRAVIYAVYTLLEKHLGCRWLNFGEHVQPGSGPIEEFVPKRPTIELPELHERHKASLRIRGFICGAWSGNTPVQIMDWAMKQKLNYFLFQAAGYEEAKEWNEAIVKGEILPRGFILSVGHHSFYTFLSPDKYFKDHPEWFALVGGKRVPGGRRNGQFCLSNPDAAKTYRANVLDFIARHPEVDIFALYPNDGYGWCECERCRTGVKWEERPQYEATQDLYLKLINPLVPEVKQRFPGKRLSIAAYVNYTQPPQKERPAPGLDVTYAFFTRNWFTDPIGNADGPVAKGPYAFDIARKHLARWVELTKDGVGNVMMYEYYTGRSAWHGRPYPLMHLIPQELAYFEQTGLAGCAVQAHWSARKFAAANLYIFAKAAWDTKLDVDATMADYYGHRYGNAAPAMAKYFAQMEENARHLQKYFVRGADAIARRDKGLADCQQFLDEAKALADTDRAKQLIAEEHALFGAYRKFQFEK